MSSSDPAASIWRFFAGAAAGLATVSALLAAAMLTVDPLGATGGNRLCPAGAKVLDTASNRMLIAERLRPRTVVLGTSRVWVGFDRRALEHLGPGPVANLGISVALPADIAALATESLAGARLERAFIGVDFNTLHQDDYTAAQAPIIEARFPTLERWRRAFLSYDALTALPRALAGCRPLLHPDGALIEAPTRADRSPRAQEDDRARVARELRPRDWDRSRFATRTARLRATIADLRRHDVQVVLFSAPYQEDLVAMFGAFGRAREFERFHADIARLAREEGVPFVDLHSAERIRDLDLPACPGGGIGCHYIDLTHYSPVVAERIAHALAAELTRSPEPTPRP